MTATDRARGTLLGLACGDALGRPVEGWPARRIRSEYGRLTEMRGSGVHRLPAGSITDDTEMTLCLARSLAECGGFDAADAADRFVEWYRGDPTGIGGMTRRVLGRVADGRDPFDASREEWEASAEGNNAGNGSVMRCAPVAVAFADADDPVLVEASRHSSRLTHADPRCEWGCAVLNLTIAAFLRGGTSTPVDSEPLTALDDATDTIRRLGDPPAELLDALDAVSTPVGEDLPVTGYVVHTLRTALSVALTADDAETAIVEAVNLGGDADTIGAVAGAVAGARFGADALPDRWLDTLQARSELASLAETLASSAMAL